MCRKLKRHTSLPHTFHPPRLKNRLELSWGMNQKPHLYLSSMIVHKWEIKMKNNTLEIRKLFSFLEVICLTRSFIETKKLTPRFFVGH